MPVTELRRLWSTPMGPRTWMVSWKLTVTMWYISVTRKQKTGQLQHRELSWEQAVHLVHGSQRQGQNAISPQQELSWVAGPEGSRPLLPSGPFRSQLKMKKPSPVDSEWLE